MKVIGEIEKNLREIVRVSVVEYQGRELVDLRVCWEHEGEYRFTKKGISIKPENLDTLIDLLKRARNALNPT